MNEHILKPNKKVYVFFRTLTALFIFFIIFLVIFGTEKLLHLISGTKFSPIIYYGYVGFAIFSVATAFIRNLVSYQKEEYVFQPHRIIHRFGGIFSNHETELVIKNITHVKMVLPFVQNRLYKTGNIQIEAAGSLETEVHIQCIDMPYEHYKYVEDLMKHNGFSLKKDKLILQQKPTKAGPVSEIVLIFIIGFFFIPGLILPLFLLGPIIALIALAGVSALVFIPMTFRILNILRREYNVYSDAIVYSETFMTKKFSFIPFENVADAENNQSLLGKMFGFSNVKISCQGNNHEIVFNYIPDGDEFQNTVDKLIDNTPEIKKTTKRKSEKRIVDTEFTANLKMNSKKVFAGSFLTGTSFIVISIIFFLIRNMFKNAPDGMILGILIGIVPTFIIVIFVVIISNIISLSATKYFVKAKSVEQDYDFIQKRNVEFTNDKLTGIVVHESILDRFLNTCTIDFWSIGNAMHVSFANISKDESLVSNILKKIGIYSKNVNMTYRPSFSFFEHIKANILSHILFILVVSGLFYFSSKINYLMIAGALIILLYFINLIYNSAYYKRQNLEFHNDYVYFEEGLFSKHRYYVTYENIMDITTTRYPFSKKGNIRFNVCGEHSVYAGSAQQQSQQNRNYSQAQMGISNAFTINYVEDIDNKDEEIDLTFTGKEHSDFKEILSSRRSIGNSLISNILLTFIFPPAVLAIPFTIWSAAVTSYHIDNERVIKRWGILYKKQKSVIHTRINHINLKRGISHKMFSNASIEINTTGSSRLEMKLKDVERYHQFYDEIKKHYQ